MEQPDYVTCISQSMYNDALTRGKKYRVLAYDPLKQQVRIQADTGRTRWYPALCFDLTGQDHPTLETFTIDDPIVDPRCDCIEVTIRLSNGQARWCYMVTAGWLVLHLDGVPLEKRVEPQ